MDPSPRPPLRLVLGSASPRRAALLAQLGLCFEQMASHEPEPEPRFGVAEPADFVARSAVAKALAVRRLLGDPAQTLIVAADTVVVVDGDIAGKPADRAAASAMLRRLSGRTHEVFTGVCLLGPGDARAVGTERTRVTMLPLQEADIAWYLASGEPYDKAGAYGIQGRGARFIERIEGCYFNVVGLPLARLSTMLTEAGYRFS